MTGADPAAFAEIEARAQMFEVSPGRVAPRLIDRYLRACWSACCRFPAQDAACAARSRA